ncbi:hypothetical protein TrCOL_g3126 [Triparma columacea]|uniref:Uncharacterized protein n=1 Tax=Triparma columacea TaxID=722753 RepID=A0A9W7FXH9_9STRA|nr:hypothetical protein TrCOL_g3126 [Triparma columacea]
MKLGLESESEFQDAARQDFAVGDAELSNRWRDFGHFRVVVTDFKKQYDGNWGLLKLHINSFGASGDEDLFEESLVMTAFVYLEFNDPSVEETEVGSLSWCANIWFLSMPHVLRVREDTFEKCTNLQSTIFNKATQIESGALIDCLNLVSVKAPNCTSVGQAAFFGCHQLRDIVLHPNAVTMSHAYSGCIALEVIAASAAGYVEEEGKGIGPTVDGDIEEVRPDPTCRIKRYVTYRNCMDNNKKIFLAVTILLELCNRELELEEHNVGSNSIAPTSGHSPLEQCKVDKSGSTSRGDKEVKRNWRATTSCPVMKFLSGPGRDLSHLVLSFVTGEKSGEGDIRWVSKEELMGLGVKYKIFNDDPDEKIKRDLIGSETTMLNGIL